MTKLEVLQADAPRVGWTQRLGGIALIIISPLIASYYTTGKMNPAIMGEFFGYYLVITGVLALIVSRIPSIKRNMGYLLLMGVFFVCAAAVEMSGEGRVIKIKAQKAAATAMMDEVQSLLLSTQTGLPLSEASLHKVPDDVRPLFTELRRRYSMYENAMNEFIKQINSPEFMSVLTPEVLQSTQGSHPALIHAQALLMELKRQSTEYLVGFPQAVELMGIENQFKTAFLSGWNKNQGQSKAVLDRYFRVEERLIDRFVDVHKFCASANTEYDKDNNQLLFYSEKELQQYNKIMTDIASLSLEESEVLTLLSNLNHERAQKFLNYRKEKGM